mgnify:FL=1
MTAPRIGRIAALLLWGLGGTTAAHADALTFHPMTPCRIVDTRIWRAGTPSQGPVPLAAGEVRSFDAVGTDLRHQGGSSTGCRVPQQDVSDLRHRAEAIAVSLTAVTASGPGHLTVFPGDVGVSPLAAVVNYVGGQTIAVGTNIPLRTDQVVGGEFQIQAAVSGTHVVVDVMGYYSRATATTFTGRMRLIPALAAGGPFRYYGAISGVDFATTGRTEHQMRVPRGCSVRRLQVEESVATPAGTGSRVYTLWGGSLGDVPLLTCATANGGFCQDTTNRSDIPLLKEILVVEAFISPSATMPGTDAMVTFEMVCE